MPSGRCGCRDSSPASLEAGAIHGYTNAFVFSAVMLGLAATTAFTLIRRRARTAGAEALADGAGESVALAAV